MKHWIFACCSLISLSLSAQQDTLYRVEQEDMGTCAYVNSAGDTIVPAGMYAMCFTDVFVDHALVMMEDDKGWRCIAVNRKLEEMYEVYWFENGPDFIEEGLYRVKKEGKIGYANEAGEIVIEPLYACAEPFQDGKARVTFECTLEKVDEYTAHISDSWFYINKKGERVE